MIRSVTECELQLGRLRLLCARMPDFAITMADVKGFEDSRTHLEATQREVLETKNKLTQTLKEFGPLKDSQDKQAIELAKVCSLPFSLSRTCTLFCHPLNAAAGGV